MKIQIKGVVYDASDILDAPIDLLMELNRQTGLEGQDVVDGLQAGHADIMAGRMPGMKTLMSTAALVWLGKRIAGEQVGFEESVAGLSFLDIQPVADPALDEPAATTADLAAPDPTQPGSVPAIEAPLVVEAQPITLQDEPFRSPGPTSEPPSGSTASPSSTSGQG